MTEQSGTIIRVYGAYYTVRDGERETNCTLRGKMRTGDYRSRYSCPAVVGDRVTFRYDADGGGSISEILPRTNAFSRKDKGKNSREDIIAANIDLILIVQAFEKPEFNLRFADRIFVRGSREGIATALCLNKSDLALREERAYLEAYYKNSGASVMFVSAVRGDGLPELKKMLYDKATILIGSSGVGKTTMLNALFPHLDLRISAVSEKTGKGRHTTTNVQMVEPEAHYSIIDTPGLRAFGVMDIEPEELADYFFEFRRYGGNCGFQPCSHDHEPRCAVKEALDAGSIHRERYVSYINILDDLRMNRETLYL